MKAVINMRVISGSARGRKLKEPTGMDIRPTTDMVKEALFSIIQFDIEGRQALDLFAGTGQLGIEVLSRGARSCVFVDAASASIKVINENLKTTGLGANAKVLHTDSVRALPGLGRFDLIFIDPPYDSGLAKSSLEKIIEFDILKENGIIICETRAETTLPEVAAPYEKLREYRYGKIKLTKYGRKASE